MYAQPAVLNINYSFCTVSINVITSTTLYSKLNERALDKITNTIYTAQVGVSEPGDHPTLFAPLMTCIHYVLFVSAEDAVQFEHYGDLTIVNRSFLDNNLRIGFYQKCKYTITPSVTNHNTVGSTLIVYQKKQNILSNNPYFNIFRLVVFPFVYLKVTSCF